MGDHLCDRAPFKNVKQEFFLGVTFHPMLWLFHSFIHFNEHIGIVLVLGVQCDISIHEYNV